MDAGTVAGRAASPRIEARKLNKPAAAALYRVKCGRCGEVFATAECVKLEHFSIYRVVCPQCHWPGRYLSSELHAPPAGAA
ncbi:MAG: hypothetical protein ACRD1E_08985, partial [Terriglobales bacterium]